MMTNARFSHRQAYALDHTCKTVEAKALMACKHLNCEIIYFASLLNSQHTFPFVTFLQSDYIDTNAMTLQYAIIYRSSSIAISTRIAINPVSKENYFPNHPNPARQRLRCKITFFILPIHHAAIQKNVQPRMLFLCSLAVTVQTRNAVRAVWPSK